MNGYRSRLGRRLLLGAVAALPVPSLAQPVAEGRTLRVVVPYAAGGAVDIVGRLVAQEISPRLGQTVVVENRTGGAGNIAMEHVAHAAPDGATLLLASPALVTNPFLFASLSYDPKTQIAPVGMVGEVPAVLVAGSDFEADDARSFIAKARQRPGAFTFGSGGTGTTEHLAGEMLKARAGIDLLHVPYRGGAQAMTDLQAGRVSVMFTNLSGALALLRGGKLKALGIADRRRNAALPEVATISEQGVPDFNVTVWWALAGPAGMPQLVVQRLNAALVDALGSASMREALGRLSATPLPGTPQDAAARFAAESENWGAVIRGAGIRAE
jgi:tripartite-type tricarboxylate transporter receptor subunit TctC